MKIIHGLPHTMIDQAAGLYAEAFGQYFAVTEHVHRHRRALIADAIQPEQAFAAIDDDSNLLGVTGYQLDGKKFIRFAMWPLIKRLGWYNGVYGRLLLSYLDRQSRRGQLVMDGIAVAPEARGRGVGTQLLRALIVYASERGLTEVRLDVVDTNPAARRLYERVGFTEAGRARVPNWFASLVGFSGSATLVLKVGGQPTRSH